MSTSTEKPRQGIQSIEVGTRLLRVLAGHGRAMMLRHLAKNAGMPAAKAHRYLVSFMRMGLVEQDANTGRYDLGSFALELGIASLGRLDPVRLAAPILDDLCERIGETVALAMWGNHGATIVRWVEAGGPITVTLRTGTVLPLSKSATGLAFVTFYRSHWMKKLLDQELQTTAAETQTSLEAVTRKLEATLDEIRAHGISRASGSLHPGINGFSAPVFDHTGNMVAAITSLGPIGNFDTEWNSPLSAALREAAAMLSARLGHHPQESAAEDLAPEAPSARLETAETPT